MLPLIPLKGEFIIAGFIIVATDSIKRKEDIA